MQSLAIARLPPRRLCPFRSLSAQFKGHADGLSPASVPGRPEPHGRNLGRSFGPSLPDPASGGTCLPATRNRQTRDPPEPTHEKDAGGPCFWLSRGRRWSQPYAQCPLAWSQYGRRQRPAGPRNHDSAPMIGPLSCWLVARREGLEPPTARSVAIVRASPPVFPIPFGPRLPSSATMPMVRVGHPSPPVPRRMAAIWSQFRAAVARPDVWRRACSGARGNAQSTRFRSGAQTYCPRKSSGGDAGEGSDHSLRSVLQETDPEPARHRHPSELRVRPIVSSKPDPTIEFLASKGSTSVSVPAENQNCYGWTDRRA